MTTKYEDALAYINCINKSACEMVFRIFDRKHRDAIKSALQAQIDGGWLDIESAPNEEWFLLWHGGAVRKMCRRYNGFSNEFGAWVKETPECKWQPLPTPPKETT